MHSPDHRSFSPDVVPHQPQGRDMRSRLSAHKGWKDRVGGALLAAAGMFGAEGCATTNTGPREEAYTYAQYDSPSHRTPQRSEYQEQDVTPYSDIERSGENTLHEMSDHHIDARSALRRASLDAYGLVRRLDHQPDLSLSATSPLFTLRDVHPVTAAILRHAVQNRLQALQRIHRQAAPAFSDGNENAVPALAAYTMLLHVREGGSIGSLADGHPTNPGYETPVNELRALFNNRLSDREIMDADAFATADFVRAYAHALQTQEDQAMARAYTERQRAQRRPIDTQDLPSGINFDATPRAPLRAAPSPAPLMDDPYGDTNQPTHHRHRRHHRGH